MALCAEGDTAAQQHFDLYCDQLARVCASIVNFVDPEVIVLGGGLSRIDGMAQDISDALRSVQLKGFRTPEVRIAEGGDASGARGAAFHARSEASHV